MKSNFLMVTSGYYFFNYLLLTTWRCLLATGRIQFFLEIADHTNLIFYVLTIFCEDYQKLHSIATVRD